MKTAGQYLLPLGLVCAMSAGCAQQAPAKINSVRDYNATLACEGGQTVQVRFAPFAAVLESQGESVDMTQQPAGDDFFYAGGGQSLRARGGEATWSDGKGAVRHCREIPGSDAAAR